MPGVRVVVRVDGEQRALGTVSFAKEGKVDGSVYLRAIGASTAEYAYGADEIPAGTANATFPTTGRLQALDRPHLSIHEGGRCHIRAGPDRHEVMGDKIPPLNTYKGAHVGSITASDIHALARLEDVWPDEGAPDADSEPWEIRLPPGSSSARVAVFVSRFRLTPQPLASDFLPRTVRRRNGKELFVGINAFGKSAALGTPGVIVIGGWDPTLSRVLTNPSRFLFIRDTIGDA